MTDLSNPMIIRSLMERHGFRTSKALGQNFLVDPTVCPRMAELSGAREASGVLEIGPGIGVLTAELARQAKKVVALELDQRLLPVLAETVGGCPHVHVLCADALKADLARILAEEFDGPAVVCANLPYYITSPVLMRLLELRLPIRRITVMVQREAAARICAAPGTRAAGAVSYAVSYYAQPEVLFDVPPESFMPRPKVVSSVIRLDIRPAPPVDAGDETRMFWLIRAAFNQRRKTLRNALSAGGFPREQAEAALRSAGIDPGARGETLTLDDFARLSRAMAAQA